MKHSQHTHASQIARRLASSPALQQRLADIIRAVLAADDDVIGSGDGAVDAFVKAARGTRARANDWQTRRAARLALELEHLRDEEATLGRLFVQLLDQATAIEAQLSSESRSVVKPGALRNLVLSALFGDPPADSGWDEFVLAFRHAQDNFEFAIERAAQAGRTNFIDNNTHSSRVFKRALMALHDFDEVADEVLKLTDTPLNKGEAILTMIRHDTAKWTEMADLRRLNWGEVIEFFNTSTIPARFHLPDIPRLLEIVQHSQDVERVLLHEFYAIGDWYFFARKHDFDDAFILRMMHNLRFHNSVSRLQTSWWNSNAARVFRNDPDFTLLVHIPDDVPFITRYLNFCDGADNMFYEGHMVRNAAGQVTRTFVEGGIGKILFFKDTFEVKMKVAHRFREVMKLGMAENALLGIRTLQDALPTGQMAAVVSKMSVVKQALEDGERMVHIYDRCIEFVWRAGQETVQIKTPVEFGNNIIAEIPYGEGWLDTWHNVLKKPVGQIPAFTHGPQRMTGQAADMPLVEYLKAAVQRHVGRTDLGELCEKVLGYPL